MITKSGLKNKQMPRLLFRYLLSELVPSFFIGLFIFSLVLLMDKIIKIVDWIIQKGVPVTDVVKMVGCLLPSFFVLTLPAAFLLSILLTFGRLNADNELCALKASGVSLYRLLPPVYLFAIFVFAVSFFLTTWAGPRSSRTFQSMAFSVATQNLFVGFKERVFFDDFPGFVCYVENIDSQEKVLRGVFIAQINYPEKPVCYFAQQGRLALDSEEKGLVLELQNGTIHRNAFFNDYYQLTHFEKFRVQLDLAYMLMPAQNRKPKMQELTLWELKEEIQRQIEAGENARKYQFGFHRLIALPFAVLIFCTIGIPLALFSQRAVRYTGFALSIGVILLYYVLMQAGFGLVQAGYLPPFIGAWISNLIMGTLGIYLLWKKAEEKPVKILESMLQAFQGLQDAVKQKLKD